MKIEYACGDEGRAYYVKGHVPIDDFKAALMREVDDDDSILSQEVSHTHMRKCRDFTGEHKHILVESKPGRGAFAVTWVQDT